MHAATATRTGQQMVSMTAKIWSQGNKVCEFMDQRPQGFDNLEQVAEALANYQPHRMRPCDLDGLVKNVRLVLSEEGAQSFLHQAPHTEYVSGIFADAAIEFLLRVAPAKQSARLTN